MHEFKDGMLPALAIEEVRAMKCMTNAHIEIANEGKLPIEFTLMKLFDAVWLWGKEVGVDFPETSNHQKDFKEFCIQLMQPWPSQELERMGLKIQPIRRPDMQRSDWYEISRTS